MNGKIHTTLQFCYKQAHLVVWMMNVSMHLSVTSVLFMWFYICTITRAKYWTARFSPKVCCIRSREKYSCMSIPVVVGALASRGIHVPPERSVKSGVCTLVDDCQTYHWTTVLHQHWLHLLHSWMVPYQVSTGHTNNVSFLQVNMSIKILFRVLKSMVCVLPQSQSRYSYNYIHIIGLLHSMKNTEVQTLGALCCDAHA